MILENRTAGAAYLFVVDLLEPELRAAAILKMTYELLPDGALRVAGDAMPLITDSFADAFGQMHSEVFFRKNGIDLCVLGTARSARPVVQTHVTLQVGRFAHTLAVYGDRYWVRGRGGLVPSNPEPFVQMPLSYKRAYGGVTEVHGEDVAWPDNPIGRGYYEREEHALGQPLPNLEPVMLAPARAWNERRPVAGWAPYPMYWGLRANRAVKLDAKTGEVVEVLPEIFNHAHPDLVVATLERGARARVEGLDLRPIEFALPTEVPRLDVSVGRQRDRVIGELDGIFLWADARRLVVTWRTRFRYAVRPEELRSAVLSMTS